MTRSTPTGYAVQLRDRTKPRSLQVWHYLAKPDGSLTARDDLAMCWADKAHVQKIVDQFNTHDECEARVKALWK